MSNSSVDFKRITDEMICLYEKKNTDYGSSQAVMTIIELDKRCEYEIKD